MVLNWHFLHLNSDEFTKKSHSGPISGSVWILNSTVRCLIVQLRYPPARSYPGFLIHKQGLFLLSVVMGGPSGYY